MQTEHDPSRALRSLADVSLQLAQDLDVARILTIVVERAMDVTGARFGAALTLDAGGRVQDYVHRGLEPQTTSALPHPPDGGGLIAVIATEKAAIRLDRANEHPAFSDAPDGDVAADAFLGVPFLHANKVVGALYLTKSPGSPKFTVEDEELVTVMGTMAAVGIENAGLLAAESDRAERGSLLRAIAQRVRRSLDTGDVLSATVQALGRAVGVDRCFIRLAAPDGDGSALGPVEIEWDAPGVDPMPGDPEAQYPVTSLAAMTRTTQWSEDVGRDPRLRAPDIDGDPQDLIKIGTNAALATPLEWGEELLGVVTLHSVLPRKWTSADVAMIEAAAREVSIAIQHARRYRQAVENAERLRRLDEMRSDFVSMVSHELRSPMTVVAGIADILEKRHDRLTRAQRNELVETLGREARRLRRLVSEVLDLESLEQGQVQLQRSRVDIVELAREAVADAVEPHRTTVAVEVEDAVVHVDRDRIKQVLLNLISNAAKFSEEEDPIRVVVGGDDGSIVVSVEDRGPGIPEDDQERLFERFSRLQSGAPKPGSGLGLFLSKQIIEQHDGTIWVESALRRGSTFSFRLPR